MRNFPAASLNVPWWYFHERVVNLPVRLTTDIPGFRKRYMYRNTTLDHLAASWDFLQGNTKGGLTFKITTILELNAFKLTQCVGSFYLLRCWSIPISACVPGWLRHSHTFTWFTVHPLIFRCLRSRKMTLTGQGYKVL